MTANITLGELWVHRKGKWHQVCSRYIVKYHTMSVINKLLSVREKTKKGP